MSRSLLIEIDEYILDNIVQLFEDKAILAATDGLYQSHDECDNRDRSFSNHESLFTSGLRMSPKAFHPEAYWNPWSWRSSVPQDVTSLSHILLYIQVSSWLKPYDSQNLIAFSFLTATNSSIWLTRCLAKKFIASLTRSFPTPCLRCAGVTVRRHVRPLAIAAQSFSIWDPMPNA